MNPRSASNDSCGSLPPRRTRRGCGARWRPSPNAFDPWARREIDSFEVGGLIHEFHQGPSRDLFVRYTTRPPDSAVAYAIATGIISRQEVPEDLLEHLALALEFYAHAPSEE